MILESTLCDRGNNYVRDIKNDKVVLALIEFLKKEISGVKEVINKIFKEFLREISP